MTQEIFCLFNYQIVGVKWMLPLRHFMTIACSCHYHVRRLFVITLFVRSSITGEDQKSPNLLNTVTDLILLLRFNKNNFEKLLSCYGRGVNFPGKSCDKSLWKSCIDGTASTYLNIWIVTPPPPALWSCMSGSWFEYHCHQNSCFCSPNAFHSLPKKSECVVKSE